jgi:magnesium transporter
MNAGERLALAFLNEHPHEAARVLERADAMDAATMLSSLAPSVAAEIFAAIGPTPGHACAAAMTSEAFAAMVAEMPLTTAAVAMRWLDKGRHEPVLQLLDEQRGAPLRRVLAFPENSAGALADPLVLALAEDITVAEAQRRLRGSKRHLYYYVYVLSRDGVLVGALNVAELMTARLKDPLSSVMQREVTRLTTEADLATIAAHPAWRDFDALPVVDNRGHFVGAIRHRTIRQMISRRGRPMMDTIVDLSELYWVGLAGMIRSLAPVHSSRDAYPAPLRAEPRDVS